MEREGKNAGVNSEASPNLEVEYSGRSQQRSGHSGERLKLATVRADGSWREPLCRVLLGDEMSRDVTIGFDNMETTGNPNKGNLHFLLEWAMFQVPLRSTRVPSMLM